jgi:hypothetical protein
MINDINENNYKILTYLHENLIKSRKKTENMKPFYEELKKDYEAYLMTGKVYEPTQSELLGKNDTDIIELFQKNRPTI